MSKKVPTISMRTLLEKLYCGSCLAFVGALIIWNVFFAKAYSCPFCSAVSLTFTEEVDQSDVAVVAQMTALPPKQDPNSLEAGKAKFKAIEVLKGEKALGGKQEFETIYFGDAPVGSTFLVMGVEPPAISWSTPIALSPRGRQYLTGALKQKKEGPERLVFFQDYLEDKEELLARDAYDEFAKAPYAAVKGMKDQMKRELLVQWIKNPNVPGSRRRLYLTMLGVCGTRADAETLASMMMSKDRQLKSGLDALVAAYLTLIGADGMPLVEDLFLKNKDAEYTDTYAAVMALRFHGQEEKTIPRERLLQGFHHMLERPQLADLVIPDLARWEDWGVMDKLVTLFKNADEESSWVRVPVINYLRACPLPLAKTRLEELAKLDPETMKRASAFMPFGVAPVTPGAANGKETKKDAAAPAGKDSTTTKPAVKDAPAKTTTGAAKPAAKTGAATVNKPVIDSPAGSKADQKIGAKIDRNSSSRFRLGEISRNPLVAQSRGETALVDSRKVYAGMAIAGMALLMAFLAILRGGQRVLN